jgi:hypothetical protein
MKDSLGYATLKSEGGACSFDPSMSLAEAKRLDEQAYRRRLLKGIETIKAGELVAFSTGECSDHSICILMRAKTDFTNADMLEALAKSGSCWSPTHRHDGFDEDKLIAYLATLDCFEEVKAREIHLGDYGRLAIDDYGYLGRDLDRD